MGMTAQVIRWEACVSVDDNQLGEFCGVMDPPGDLVDEGGSSAHSGSGASWAVLLSP